jgi:hypothetical protein
MLRMRLLGLACAGLALGLVSTSARAQTYYEPGYHRHKHHHGHVHGNPRRPHLDCRWYGDHEHCQLHIPRRKRHWGHVHGNPRRPHLDCRWHRDHEHCRVHVPRRYHDDD